jgi:multidrug efflux system membrane fusion protein
VAALAALGACKKGGEGAPAGKGPGGRGPVAFPVQIETVQSRDVEYSLSAVGSVEAFEKVQVTARVQGVVEQVRFAEGQRAKKGEVLVEIEPSRYALAVRAAKAQREKAAASKAEAEAGLKRREAASEASPGLIRGEELETWRTRARTASAELSAADVAVAQAELNLRDSYVRAPVEGVLQTRTVQTGQFVQPGAVLATLVQRDPLLLRFKVPEPDAARIKAGTQVTFKLRGEARPYQADITHVAGMADETSRMVTVTAEINDPAKENLRPGAFAEVTIPVDRRGDAPVIPQTAVRPSERGFLAYVVENGIARERVLNLGMRTLDGRVEVLSGVKAGEKIVVRGGEALREGAKVKVEGEAAGPSGPERARASDDAGGSRPGGRP